MNRFGNATTASTDFWSLRRVKVGYSIPDLARKVGVSEAALHNWFNGSGTPRDRVCIYRLCKCLEVNYLEGLSRFNLAPAVLADTIATHNITIEEIRDTLGVTPAKMRAWLKKKQMPDSSQLNNIADLLGIDRCDLFRSINTERLGISNTQPSDCQNEEDILPESTPTVDTDAVEVNSEIKSKISIKDLFNILYDEMGVDDTIAIITCANNLKDSDENFDASELLDKMYYGAEISREHYDNLSRILHQLNLT